MIRKILTVLFLTIIVNVNYLFSQTSEYKGIYKGFIGGMFFHTGFADFDTEIQNNHIKGTYKGIGGKIAFNFTDYFRIGSEGYSSQCNYDEKGSYISFGWGGILLESGVKVHKFRFFAGSTFGGGGVSNLFVVSGNSSDFENDDVIFRKYSTFVYSPFLGCEFFAGKKLTLVLKSDFLSTVNNQFEGNNNSGLRIYVGIMFRK